MSKDLQIDPIKQLGRIITGEEISEVSEKPYTLRKLYDEDIYTVVEILGAIIPEDVKEAFVQVANGEKKVKDIGAMVGFDIIKLILKNFSSIKNEVYAFLSDLSGIPADDIRKMPFGTTPRMLKEVFQNAENADFFKELFKSFL